VHPHPAAEQPHPLAELITAAAARSFPAVDGGWHRVPPWRPDLFAVIAFTGHAVLVVPADVPDALLMHYGVDGFGGAHDPRLISALAGPDGWIDSIDLIMAAHGTAPTTSDIPTATPHDTAPSTANATAITANSTVPSTAPTTTSGSTAGLVPRPDLAGHPRARHAQRIRSNPRVFGYSDVSNQTLAIVSNGVAGLLELSFELDPRQRGTGRGPRLIRDALRLIPAGTLVIASVAPGNAASLRSLLDAGFVPLASLQLFRPVPADQA
jgi:hypothetical protein